MEEDGEKTFMILRDYLSSVCQALLGPPLEEHGGSSSGDSLDSEQEYCLQQFLRSEYSALFIDRVACTDELATSGMN